MRFLKPQIYSPSVGKVYTPEPPSHLSYSRDYPVHESQFSNQLSLGLNSTLADISKPARLPCSARALYIPANRDDDISRWT